MNYVALLLLVNGSLYACDVSDENALRVAQLIWRNECGGSIEGLTHWNKNENFPSLGIGHFIWYPENQRDRFEETFPELLAHLKEQKVAMPEWLTEKCPWATREEFEVDSRMGELQQFLYDTREQQALFIAQRLEKALEQSLPLALNPLVEKLAATPQGLYALIDYHNFKGMGNSEAERYQGMGWGLIQVLEGIPNNSQDVLNDFIASAKQVLQRRVENAPPDRNEQRWLAGWTKRVESYADDV